MGDVTYYLRNTVSDLSGGADFNLSIFNVAGSGTNSSFNINGSATEDSYAYTPAGTPSGFKALGPSAVDVSVTSANSALAMSVAVARVNSAGVIQATSAFAAEQLASATGTYTFSIPSPQLGPWQTGDRLLVIYRFRNTGTMTQSITIGIGTSEIRLNLQVPTGMMALF